MPISGYKIDSLYPYGRTQLRIHSLPLVASHYLLDVIEKTQFDTVYHEHIRTYSLKSLVALFGYYDMEVFDVRRADRYGGNIRAYVARKGTRRIAPSVKELLDLEVAKGLFDPRTYVDFRNRVSDNRDRLMERAFQARRQGQRFVGNSCGSEAVKKSRAPGVGARGERTVR